MNGCQRFGPVWAQKHLKSMERETRKSSPIFYRLRSGEKSSDISKGQFAYWEEIVWPPIDTDRPLSILRQSENNITFKGQSPHNQCASRITKKPCNYELYKKVLYKTRSFLYFREFCRLVNVIFYFKFLLSYYNA